MPGSVGEFAPQNQLVGKGLGTPTNHVSDMQFGGLVCADVYYVIAKLVKLGNDLGLLALGIRELHAYKDMCVASAGVAVVELSNRTIAEHLNEAPIASALLRNADGEQDFARLANFGSFGDMAQTIEVHVGARVDCDQAPRASRTGLGVGLKAGERQSACRLSHNANILENILDRRAYCVRIRDQNIIEQLSAKSEGFLAGLSDCDAIGEQADTVEHNAFASVDCRLHRSDINWLNPDHLGFGTQKFDIGRDAGGEATAADWHENRLDRVRMLMQDFNANSALPSNHIAIIIGVDEGESLCLFDLAGTRMGFVEGVAM
jgi:hypothetical protein